MTTAIKKQLKYLKEQLAASEETAKAVKAAAHPQIEEIKELAAPKEEPGRTLPCKDCSGSFFFSDSEARYYQKWEMNEPLRCGECRVAKKAKMPQPLEIQCNDCGDLFIHSVAAQKHYEASGFDLPIRCVPCREQKKAGKVPQQISCQDCKSNFSFSVAKQLDFKKKGWAAPKRCSGCSKAKKMKAKEPQKNEISDAAKDQAAELAALDASEASDAAKKASNIGNVADLLDAALASVGLPTGVVIRPGASV